MYVNVDDCWQNRSRDASGKLQADSERRVVYIAALRAADRGDLEPLLRFVGAIT